MTPASGEYRLDIGGVVIALHCRPEGFAEGLMRWFGRASAPGAAHLDLDIELVTHADDPALPRSLVTTKRLLPDGRFDIADGLVTGHYDPASRRGHLQVKQVLVRGRLMRIFEQLLYQAFWSARADAGSEAFLVHSSAVVADRRGFLFVGTSGAGKSTVAELSARHHVLGDEMSLVQPGPDGWEVIGTPFNGLFRTKRPGQAPLTAVLLLRQAARHALVEATPLEAVTTLTPEIVPPLGLEQVPDAGTLAAMTDLAAELADHSSLKFLEFRPDDGFWREIAGAYALKI